jgi:hypothetical protein
MHSVMVIAMLTNTGYKTTTAYPVTWPRIEPTVSGTESNVWSLSRRTVCVSETEVIIAVAMNITVS